jgi:hypothetical protein
MIRLIERNLTLLNKMMTLWKLIVHHSTPTRTISAFQTLILHSYPQSRILKSMHPITFQSSVGTKNSLTSWILMLVMELWQGTRHLRGISLVTNHPTTQSQLRSQVSSRSRLPTIHVPLPSMFQLNLQWWRSPKNSKW